jgi:hypothetical protein
MRPSNWLGRLPWLDVYALRIMSWTSEQLALVDAARELDIAVRVEDVGVGPSGLREDVDDAYRDKYGGGSTGNMVEDEAAATTLRLLRT